MRATISQMVLEELDSWLKKSTKRPNIRVTCGRPGIDEWKVSETVHALIIFNGQLGHRLKDVQEELDGYKEAYAKLSHEYEIMKNRLQVSLQDIDLLTNSGSE